MGKKRLFYAGSFRRKTGLGKREPHNVAYNSQLIVVVEKFQYKLPLVIDLAIVALQVNLQTFMVINNIRSVLRSGGNIWIRLKMIFSIENFNSTNLNIKQ